MDMEEIQNNPTDPLVTLWSRKWAILIFALIATVTAVVGSFFLPKEYEAKSTVLVFPEPKIEKRGSLRSSYYKDLVMTSGILQRVIDRLIPNHPNIKNSLFPKILERMISIDTRDAKEFEALLMSFRVRGQNPLLIRDIANTTANLLSEVSEQIKKSKMSKIKGSADTTNTQFISIKKKLSEAEKTLNTIRAEKPSLLDELMSMKKRLGVYNYQLTMLELQLNEESFKLAFYKEIKSELSEFMKTDRIRAEISIKTLLAKKKLLTKSIKQLKKMIPLLENKTMAMRLKEKPISRKIKVLEEQFFLLSKLEKHAQESRIAGGKIKLISKAIKPHLPVSPNRLKIILITLVLSLVVGMVAALAKKHLDTAR